MALRSKQSEASDIDSGHSVFFWARLKLTAVYVLVVTLIVFGFSFFLYQAVSRDLVDSAEGDFATDQAQQAYTARALDSIQNDLIVIDLIILILATGSSYFFAGYTLRPIQKSLEAQKVFSEHASHELRTPLAVMKNDVEVLLRNHNPTKEQIRSTLRSSIEEIDRLSRMVADLLALARSQNHTLTTVEKVDITAIAKTTMDKMRSLAANKDVSVAMHGDAHLMVLGNASAFERILTNLLQNAIEHTRAGGSVTVETRQEGSHATLTVSDTGVGIDEKDLPHVFERFYKGEGEPGSGLGLSIVKALVSQHTGQVEATSLKGKGTTITLRLPLSGR